jgi:tetratricopeptide (TPR) repeat protein
MAKVYVSSTYQDLIDHRAACCKQLRKHGHQVISMEDYNPGTRRPLAKCLADVAQADIYVGIVGWRYGHVPADDNPDGLSITEREYRHALDHVNEIIILMVDETVAWAPLKMDSHTGEGNSGALIKTLRTALGKDHTCGFFDTPDNLAAKLSPAIEEAYKNIHPPQPATLDRVESLARSELVLLATLFEVEKAYDLNDAALKQLLQDKAEEYRALKSEIDAIDDGMKRLSNLKAAAQDAIQRVDLDEVEELLSRVQEVELEEAAKTAELRANNALLRGRVEQAFRILSAAADSFGSVDPLEPARKRILSYFAILRNHGLRYGGPGLPLSREILVPVLTDELHAKDAPLWAAGKNWRGVAMHDQGAHIHGPVGDQLLADAVCDYNAALEVRSRTDFPEQWAMTQNNIANALSCQSRRTNGPDAAQLLAEAITAYRAALKVYTRADFPVEWATTQNNLANALQSQGKLIDTPKGAQLLAEAVAAYQVTLEVRTRVDFPVDWAMTQNNLGVALRELGTRADGSKAGQVLTEAVTAFRAALEVTERADFPVQWAMIQESMSQALKARAVKRDALPARNDLAQALAAVEGALEVYHPEDMSFDHAKATRLRDGIQSDLANLPD